MVGLLPGLCSVTFRKLEPQAVIELAAAAGIRGIEWGGDVHLPPGNLVRARDLRDATEAAGLTPASYGTYLRPPQHGADDAVALIETALMLGATNIRIWPGYHQRPSADYSADDLARAAEAIRDVAAMAGERGVTVSLEYHPGTLTDSLASARQLIASVAHPNLFTYWQPRPGLPLEPALDEIHALGSEISHLHVFAWDEHARRYPLADQDAYWWTVFDELEPSRWPGDRYAMIEFVRDDSVEQFREDAATLCALLESAGGESPD